MLAALLGIILLLGTLPTSTFAATECGYIGIRGCAIPKAGAKPDFDVEENWPSQYTIMTVNWYKGSVSAANAVGGTDTFQGNTVYIVEFEVWAKSGYYFTTDTNGYTTVEADVSPNYAEYGEFDAQVYNVYGKDNTKYLTVRYTFPKTESTATILNSIAITGVDVPRAGDRTAYPVVDLPTGVKYYTDSKGYYYDVAWYDGTKKLSNLEYFEEGKTYVCHLSLRAADGYEFATDPNVSTWPTVSVTVNGKSATVVPDYSQGSGSEIIIVAAQFVCEPSRQIQNVEILGVTEPKTDEKPSYSVSFGHSTYGNYPLSNYAYVDGVAWMTKDGTLLNAKTDTFQPSTVYTVEIRLKAKDPYLFRYTLQNTPVVSATVNGNAAVALAHDDKDSALIVRYTFKKTKGREVSKVEVNDIDLPVVGEYPDYEVTYGDTTYGEQKITGDEYIKNGVLWHCDTTGKYMKPGVDKFIGGYDYSVFVYLSTITNYEFKYVSSSDSYTVSGKINGKSAYLEECNNTDAIIGYTFTAARKEITNVKVDGIDAPKEGELADYEATLGDTTYAPMYTKEDAETRNSIMWYDETTGEYMKPGVDRFIGGHKYSVIVILKTTGVYTFKYVPETDSYTVTAKINGKTATIEECVEDTVTFYYDFVCEEHKCSARKVDSVKATCSAEGKKEYYHCDSCGKNYEDSKCTKAISDIDAWGIIEKLEHAGGKATCDNRAICKNCGERYGALAEHNFGTAWDYKDANGHAHKCKVCGIHDTVVPHSGGTAKCGEVAKCSVCKTEYGEAMQHKWSTQWDYTDSKGHAHKCTVCGEHDTVQAHAGGTADCKNKAKCSACGTEYGKTGDHKWSTQWDYTDSKGHAHKCTVCGDHDDTVKHTPGTAATESSPQLCTTCSYVITPAKQHEHTLSKVAKVGASCTSVGKEQHYVCSGCSKLFSDSKGTNEITDPDSIVIPAAGHKEKWKSDADNHWKECSVKDCGAVTVEKEAHNFNKAGKCTVCSYKSAETTDSTQNTDATHEEDTTHSNDPDVNNDNPDKDTDNVSDTTNTTDPDAADNHTMVMWIAVIASGVIAITCVIIVAVVLAKNNKRKK